MKHAKTIWGSALLVTASHAGIASAHTLTSTTVGLAGSGVTRSDVYQINCFNDGDGVPARIMVRVRDNAPVKAPRLTIQAKRGTAASTLVADAVDGDAAYSPMSFLAKGAGVYTVTVNKSAYTGTVTSQKGPESYTGEAHCQTAGGLHTGTDIRLVQNQ